MNEAEDIRHLKSFYESGVTRGIPFRTEQLSQLLLALTTYENKIIEALAADLGKSPFESYATEIGLVRDEIRLHRRKLKAWTRQQKQSTPLTALPAKSYTVARPLGVSLIISPWNYPLQLALMPLTSAISAGNCAAIKPSEYSVSTSALLEEMICKYFDQAYIKVFTGGQETSQNLLYQGFDHIFFTGSTRVGKIVMRAAAEQLIPVTLELGGKSPCIVDQNTNIRQAAKRIVWGKCINAGQTCIAPDYVLVHRAIKQELLNEMKKATSLFFGSNPIDSIDYPRIVNRANYNRLQQLMQDGTLVYGGQTNENLMIIAPTLIDEPQLDSPLMNEEIFGPLLPVISFENTHEAIQFVRNKPNPLALYIFSHDKHFQKQVMQNIQAGGITLNDTLMHFTNAALPFGGIGNSGIGNYHGKAGFEAFSHRQSVMKRATWIDIPVRYPPYGQKIKLLKWLMK